MAGKKGMKKYPESIKAEIIEKHKQGESVWELHRKDGVSRWAIQNWCGLTAKAQEISKQRGRKPAVTLAEYKYENKRLKMENELLRDFLHLAGRK